MTKDEGQVRLTPSPDDPLVALAFKLVESPYGQLTYLRIYQGTIRKSDTIENARTRKKIRVPRVVRMHAAEMEDIDSAVAGDIVALFGVDCSSGDTFTAPGVQVSMLSMHVPEPVISIAVKPKEKATADKFTSAIQRFIKEDPTFRSHGRTKRPATRSSPAWVSFISTSTSSA